MIPLAGEGLMRRVLVMAATIVMAAAPGYGQDQPTEISVDGGFQLDMLDNSDNVTSFTIPFQRVRLATGVGARTSLEGALRFRYASQGDNSITETAIAPGLTYHFRDFETAMARPYVAVSGILSHVDADTGVGSGGDTRFGFGGDVGVKMPIAETGFVRLEAGFAHFAESDNFDSVNSITLTVGLGALLK